MLDLYVNDALPIVSYASTMENIETMGDRIRMLREAKGLTQLELGNLCGVSKSAVSQWERNETANIKLQTFLTLLEVLGTRYEYLLKGPKALSSANRQRTV